MQQETAATLSTRISRLFGCGLENTPADRKNGLRVLIFTLIWVVVFLTALSVMERYGDNSLAVSAFALTAAVVAWIPVIAAYLRFLREADELMRLIHVQAMATAFGAGLGAALLWRFFERISTLAGSGSLLGEAIDLLQPAMVMPITFTIAVIILRRRYSQ